MKKNLTSLAIAASASLSILGALCVAGPALAQVAGTTTTAEAGAADSTKLAMGWSVKKTLMGKTIYNEAGQKVGTVEDLIISPDKSLTYVIVGAGGFVGIGRHDVAVAVTQIQDKAGKLVMAGATQATIKAMPSFAYSSDTSRRDAFAVAADKDIAKGKLAVASLQKKAGLAAVEAKAGLTVEINTLQRDLKSAEDKLAEMKQASATRWKEFEADLSAATARLRKSIEKATA
jgi:sporulation protein YlmC with PRC-barrel domain